MLSDTIKRTSLLPDEGIDTSSAERGAGCPTVFAELLQKAKMCAPHISLSLVTLLSSRCEYTKQFFSPLSLLWKNKRPFGPVWVKPSPSTFSTILSDSAVDFHL